jgi:F420-non-reducing hydrogenase large subunit
MAAAKTLDDLYGVTPPPAALAIRELFYDLFLFEDHILHFYFLGGPDFLVDAAAAAGKRNILGVIEKVGAEAGKRVIEARGRAREIMGKLGGKPTHPVLGLPGGVAKRVTEEVREEVREFAREAVDFALFSLNAFEHHVLADPTYLDLIKSDDYREETHYLGTVDDENRVAFYDGTLRVVDPEGEEKLRFTAREYANVIAEHVEEWTYIKFPYLRAVGWKGFVGGRDSGIVRVAPLARLNVADGMSTPKAQEEYERLYAALGPKPVHLTLAFHWARLVEILNAAERIAELAGAEELTSPEIRNLDLGTPKEGMGVVEAPRGTLLHHYETDERGVITKVNLIVATLFNSAPISMSIERAARGLIREGEVDETLLNRVEMALRAYDPCLSCATHHEPGRMPLSVAIRRRDGSLVERLLRGHDGRVLHAT